MRLVKLWVAMCLCTCGLLTIQGQSRVIAHRGFWEAEGAAQNSIVALQKAAEAKVYGSEFDVQLSADGVVVVNHDAVIDGRVIAETTYKQLRKIKLKNGELLPSLKEYLKKGKKFPRMLLILEIKPHKTKEQEEEITKKVVKMVKAFGMEKQVEYISFSLNVCELLVKYAPGSEVAFLSGNLSPDVLKKKGLTGIDYNYSVLYKHPEWIRQAHELGMTVNAWTVDGDKDMKKLVGMKVDFLTTNKPLQALELVRTETIE